MKESEPESQSFLEGEWSFELFSEEWTYPVGISHKGHLAHVIPTKFATNLVVCPFQVCKTPIPSYILERHYKLSLLIKPKVHKQ